MPTVFATHYRRHNLITFDWLCSGIKTVKAVKPQIKELDKKQKIYFTLLIILAVIVLTIIAKIFLINQITGI